MNNTDNKIDLIFRIFFIAFGCFTWSLGWVTNDLISIMFGAGLIGFNITLILNK